MGLDGAGLKARVKLATVPGMPKAPAGGWMGEEEWQGDWNSSIEVSRRYHKQCLTEVAEARGGR